MRLVAVGACGADTSSQQSRTHRMWHRVFASRTIEQPPSRILEMLHQNGFHVEARFRGDDLGWFACEFQLPGNGAPIYLERFLTKEDEIRDELNTWAAWAEAQHYEPRRFDLMGRLVQAQELFTLRRPMDHADEATLEKFCQHLCQWLATETDGVYQIDGKGFFNPDGVSLLEEF